MSMYVPVKEALLAAQPNWADHGRPNIAVAWAVAGSVGLDVDAARKLGATQAITDVLTQDMADVRAAGVRQTPTFFVNGKPLPSFGIKQLEQLVQSEVEAARKR
jgi:protein-disulfide isomerase